MVFLASTTTSRTSISKYANCEIPIFGYAPNASVVCRPQHIQFVSTVVTGDLVDKALKLMSTEKKGVGSNDRLVRMGEKALVSES